MTTQRIPLSPSAAQNQIEVTITYLEQRTRPVLAKPAAPARKTALMRAAKPPVHFYRYLYDLVGGPYNWVSRRRLSDEELAAIIHDDDVYLYILYLDGVPAGMAEIDARARDDHELKFFGLAPEATGCGLGRFFLTNVIELAWARDPKRLLLETCTLDHPAALPLYQKLGFSVSNRRKGMVERIEPARS